MRFQYKGGEQSPLSNYKKQAVSSFEISPTKTDEMIVRYIRAYSTNKNGDGNITHYIYKIVILNSIDLANIYVPATPENILKTRKVISKMEKDTPFHLASITFINLRMWKYEYTTKNRIITGIKGEADTVTMED